MAFAIPLATMAVQAYMSHRAQKKAEQRSKEEQAALQPAQESNAALQQFGTGLMQGGVELQRPAGNFYKTLLTGDRAATGLALAAPTAQITDVYRGAERGLERSGVRGAAKDVAEADLNRQRASQISGLITGVQPAAAGALSAMGESQAGMGSNAVAASSGLNANLLNQAFAARKYARDEGAQAGAAWGRMIADTAGAMGGGGGNTGFNWGGFRQQPTMSTAEIWNQGYYGPGRG